ncbi:hypothetical protein ACWT_4696 [Actinoplanes sp. SE50]|uniref:DUF4360 domain-containing protein n=1 Tax=unclassified Actinoplanes TaxID=2626549 RepID=UPI00023EBD84|nr:MULTISPECIES: DUF4360 domain-containing protein [unclassified Actinoplanes]AEV85718.1 hypothetical protein ACPL_4827 [Actinoplanes sp. SE50/110]ATO84111.1 hypothetical protein ACWT_4696 [Actinoplanes sp. SE50]SLM01521.1 uncharacterized protein ACSP50_4757 [Actinoplanes sp. SE50/110]
MRNRNRALVAAVITTLTLPFGTPAHAATDAGAAAAAITVEVIAASGSGCAPGTASVVSNGDDTGFRVRYRDFVATAGGDADVVDRRKNCQLGVLVSIPDGWTVAIASANYRGRASLRSGATALQRTSYYWQGSSATARKDVTFSGPYSGLWTTWDVAPVLTYAACGSQSVLNVNTELRLNAGSSTGTSTMSMNTTEGDVDTLFNFSLSPC